MSALLILGLACLFMGLNILYVAGLPWALRSAEKPKPEPGTPEAFGLFWIDQYAWIGFTVLVIGLICTPLGLIG